MGSLLILPMLLHPCHGALPHESPPVGLSYLPCLGSDPQYRLICAEALPMGSASPCEGVYNPTSPILGFFWCLPHLSWTLDPMLGHLCTWLGCQSLCGVTFLPPWISNTRHKDTPKHGCPPCCSWPLASRPSPVPLWLTPQWCGHLLCSVPSTIFYTKFLGERNKNFKTFIATDSFLRMKFLYVYEIILA